MNELIFEEVRNEMTPIPGFKSTEYLAHCPSGQVYSLLSGKWLLQDNPKGTGGSGNCYLMTSLKNENGVSDRMYLHEMIMSSYMGISKEDWRAMGLEIDHIDNEKTKDCSISNLRLVSSSGNKKNSRDRNWNKTRLSMEIANEIREEFKTYEGSKVEWYVETGKRYLVSARSIQNIILGQTYADVEVG